VPEEIRAIIDRFDAIDLFVVTLNVLLMIFAKHIMRAVYHGADDDRTFILRVRIFRAFNLAIMGAFIYYHLQTPSNTESPAFKLVSSLIVLYVGYVISHGVSSYVHTRYGKRKELDGKTTIVETYNSRLIGIITSLLIYVIVIVAVVRILGFDSWLEAGGVLGVIGVFLAITQAVWAPDLFNGLIILNSGMLEPGDVVEFRAEEHNLAVVHKTRLFHTELLNLVNNHRLMVRNTRMRDLVIHNLSRFASARGLREKLSFKIGYEVTPEKARKMFERAFANLVADKDLAVEDQHGIEVRTVDAGDYAIEYACFFHTKDIRNILKIRHKAIEYIICQAQEDGIELFTPTLHSAQVVTSGQGNLG